MSRNAKILVAKTAVILAVPILIYAYAEGPDAGYSGVPGEGDCTYCHTGPSGSGSVSVQFPNGLSYTPGVTQHLKVTVADPVQIRWGFELTARQSNNSSAQAGTFNPGADGYTQIVCTQPTFQTESFGSCSPDMTLQYIEHTYAGTRYGQANSATFEFDWVPPSTNVGSVTVYVAGNAANGDGTNQGDHIYLQNYSLKPAQSNQPVVSSGGVVNAASYKGGICAGSWVTILGTKLANSTRSWRASDFVNGKLPTQLDGVSVEINGKPAYVSYISPTQINVQSPTDASLGPVNVVVTNNGVTSTAATGQLQTASPAFFLWSGKYAVATRSDYSLVGPPNLFPNAKTVPAKPGDVIILWGTGFGPTNPAVPAGEETPSEQTKLVHPVTVLIGNISAKVVGAALSPGNAGLYQVAVEVPSTVGSGDQAVVAQVAGINSPAGVYVNVQP